VLHTWPPSNSNSGSEPLSHLLYLHYSCTCSPHACMRLPGHAAALVLTQNKETNILHPCLSSACASRPGRSNGLHAAAHTCTHACINAEQNTRSFTCIAFCAHWPRVPTIIAVTDCDRDPAGKKIDQHKQSPKTPSSLPCPKMYSNPTKHYATCNILAIITGEGSGGTSVQAPRPSSRSNFETKEKRTSIDQAAGRPAITPPTKPRAIPRSQSRAIRVPNSDRFFLATLMHRGARSSAS
jgi:hypothetical protein